jgi:hypothetical protein
MTRNFPNALYLAVFLAAVAHGGSLTAQPGDESESRVQLGFAMAPVPLDPRGKNHALVGLGSYIVNAEGGCVDCHTSPPLVLPGGNPYAGEPKRINAPRYLGGGAAFGPFISRNLTPDALGRPGGLTLADFLSAMQEGRDHKHLPPHVPSVANDLLQVMPWPFYQDMRERDLEAIYEYLRAIPCLEGGPGIPPNRC